MSQLLIDTIIICIVAGLALLVLIKSPLDAEIKAWGRWIILVIFAVAIVVQVLIPLLRGVSI